MERVILTVMQPCVLCEGDLEEWRYYRDDATRTERLQVKPLLHECAALAALMRERHR